MRPTRHILSFGGGINSVALMLWLPEHHYPLDEVIFADTGCELPETYAYLPIAEAYLAARAVKFTVVEGRVRGRDLYQTCWERRVIPSTIWRWSTRDFKVRPIYRYYRSLKAHIMQYLAIAYDEFDRMRTSEAAFVTNVYPLVEHRLTRTDCASIIREAGLPMPVKSACFFCPFSSIDRWQWLYQHHPDLYQRAVALEERSKHFPAQRLTDQVFRKRASVPLRELPKHFDTRDEDLRAEPQQPCGAECFT